jgi:uncharacterized protein YbaA (DUF1428 family)
MGLYVDCFLFPITTKNMPAYKKMAKLACKIWMEPGALSYVEPMPFDINAMSFGDFKATVEG